MVEFRVLTDEGVQMFRTFLEESARSGEPAPTHLLNDRNYSKDFTPKIHIAMSMKFESKQDFGRYLVKVFDDAGVTRQMISKNRNFWTSLVLRYFDQFCSVDSNGRRKVPMEKKDQYIINLLLFICFIVSFSFGEKNPADMYTYMHLHIHIYM